MANDAPDPLEASLDGLEESFGRLDRRLAGVEALLGGVRADIHEEVARTKRVIAAGRTQSLSAFADGHAELLHELADLRAERRRRFYWLMGAVIASGVVRTILAFVS